MWISLYFSFDCCNTSVSTQVVCLHIGSDHTLNFYFNIIVTDVPIWWPSESAGYLMLCTQCLGSHHRISLFLLHFGLWGVSLSFFLTSPSLGWEAILSLASRAEILAFVLVWCLAGLMPCCLWSICCSLVMEFKTALLRTFYFPHECHHSRPLQLTPGIYNPDWLHN